MGKQDLEIARTVRLKPIQEVAATVELFLVALSPGLVRRYDEVTGLKLLDL